MSPKRIFQGAIYPTAPVDPQSLDTLGTFFATPTESPNPRLHPYSSALDSGFRRNDGRYRSLESVGTGRDLGQAHGPIRYGHSIRNSRIIRADTRVPGQAPAPVRLRKHRASGFTPPHSRQSLFHQSAIAPALVGKPQPLLHQSGLTPFPITPKGGIMPGKIETQSLSGTFRFRYDPEAPQGGTYP